MADQAGLGAAARQENLAGAFRLRRPISAAAAVLVDDLVTTGSSLTEAARVLGRPGSRTGRSNGGGHRARTAWRTASHRPRFAD